MARSSSLSWSADRLLRLGLPFIALVSGTLACAPDLPVPTRRAGAPPGTEGGGGVRVEIEPPAPIEAAPPILRLRVFFGAGAPVDLARVFLIEGEIGPSHVRQIERGDLSKALSARVVPALVWLDEAALPEQVVVVAPTVPLELGATFSIASGEPSFSAEIRVLEDDPTRTLERVWPPLEGGVAASLGIWCGAETIAPFEVSSALEPGGPSGFFRAGAVEGAGLRCARFEAEPGSSGLLRSSSSLVSCVSTRGPFATKRPLRLSSRSRAIPTRSPLAPGARACSTIG